MKEQDYLNVRELAAVTHAKEILLYIMPELSKCITEEEYRPVMQALSKWQDDLYKIAQK